MHGLSFVLVFPVGSLAYEHLSNSVCVSPRVWVRRVFDWGHLSCMVTCLPQPGKDFDPQANHVGKALTCLDFSCSAVCVLEKARAESRKPNNITEAQMFSDEVYVGQKGEGIEGKASPSWARWARPVM